MSEYVFKLPDLGEGTVEAEIVEWHVKPGDAVSEGQIIADVMTDKANVEVPAPVTGTVLRTSGEPGDVVAVGAELAAFAVAGAAPAQEAAEPGVPEEQPEPPMAAPPARKAPAAPSQSAVTEPGKAADAPTPAARGKVITSPAIRKRAKEAGIDLTTIAGSGPRGRILRSDLEAALSAAATAAPRAEPRTGVGPVETHKVIGVRRLIASRLQAAKREIPHFAYVEEVDVTALEALRTTLNARRRADAPSLTYLPFLSLALVRALKDFPHCNAHFDAESGMLKRFERVHLGIATQTPEGLKVPVVHNADSRSLWNLASEIARVAEAARTGSASREELTGSTITITSLGRLGGIASTPVINAPEMGIIGVNKAVKRPMVGANDQIEVRLMMNLSSSFDHRFVDGFDAASLIQALKAYLEEPALIFVD
jgi:2-oxoisovalerate dehydrogenase E2 component (dihydrolipoyl transacylase)